MNQVLFALNEAYLMTPCEQETQSELEHLKSLIHLHFSFIKSQRTTIPLELTKSPKPLPILIFSLYTEKYPSAYPEIPLGLPKNTPRLTQKYFFVVLNLYSVRILFLFTNLIFLIIMIQRLSNVCEQGAANLIELKNSASLNLCAMAHKIKDYAT